MPETFILDDYLANAISKKLGARNGPRDRSDVWLQAARLLLTHEVPEAPANPFDARPTDGEIAPATRRPKATSSAEMPARP
jgi:hypothetical protein